MVNNEKLRMLNEDSVLNKIMKFSVEYFGDIAVLCMRGNKKPLYATTVKDVSLDPIYIMEQFLKSEYIARVEDAESKFYLQNIDHLRNTMSWGGRNLEIKVFRLAVSKKLEERFRKLEEKL